MSKGAKTTARAILLAAAALGAALAVPSDCGQTRGLQEYVEYRLESRFPQMDEEQADGYAQAIADAVASAGENPAGKAGTKKLADYVISGIYYVDGGHTSFIHECEDPASGRNCITDEQRAKTGLHFAAPDYEEIEMVALPRPKVEFAEALGDAVALDGLADSLLGRVRPVAGTDEAMAEIMSLAAYFVRVGLLHDAGDFIPPISVESVDSSTFSNKSGAAYTEDGIIYIGSEYLAGASPENAGYLRHIESHEPAHLQGVDNETRAEIVSLAIDALAGADGSIESEYAAALTLRQDALWTAIFSMDYPSYPPPSDFSGRMEVIENLPTSRKSYGVTGDTGLDWHRSSRLERLSDAVNAEMDGAAREREAAALAEAVGSIYASDPQEERAAFEKAYREWKTADSGTMNSRLEYRVMPYVLLHYAGEGDGTITANFIEMDRDGNFLPMTERRMQTIDLRALLTLLERARQDYSGARSYLENKTPGALLSSQSDSGN